MAKSGMAQTPMDPGPPLLVVLGHAPARYRVVHTVRGACATTTLASPPAAPWKQSRAPLEHLRGLGLLYHNGTRRRSPLSSFLSRSRFNLTFPCNRQLLRLTLTDVAPLHLIYFRSHLHRATSTWSVRGPCIVRLKHRSHVLRSPKYTPDEHHSPLLVIPDLSLWKITQTAPQALPNPASTCRPTAPTIWNIRLPRTAPIIQTRSLNW